MFIADHVAYSQLHELIYYLVQVHPSSYSYHSTIVFVVNHVTIQLHTHTHTHTHTRTTHGRTNTCTHTHTHAQHMDAQTHAHACMHTHIHTHTQTYVVGQVNLVQQRHPKPP